VVFLFAAVISLILLPISYRRSGSMTRYVMKTGAPVMWALVLFSSLLAACIDRWGEESTAVQTFIGGLIGTVFVQIYLMRRQARANQRGEGS
jgi:hypothetical protein